MSGHTPGPWRVDESARQAGYKVAASTPKQHGGGNAVCTCRPANRSAEAFGEAEANARLIAVAPNLLAELKRLVSALEPLERDGNWPLDGAGIATLNAARAAIAAAEPKP